MCLGQSDHKCTVRDATVNRRLKILDVATIMSSIGLWTPDLKLQVRHYGCHHFVFLEPEVTTFRQEAGAVVERGMAP